MAFIGEALGAGGQSNWGAEGTAQLINPVTGEQIQKSYDQSQQGLQQQQAFVNALQSQNGIANQNAAFTGFQGMANGTGPNPAQAQLAQATQANIANQAAMAAGQRGAGQNVGMMARGAANQGANVQQQAVGQAATMGAQQQVQGLQGMAGVAGQQVNNLAGATQGYNQAAQSEQGNLMGAAGNYNSSVASVLGGQNKANSDIATQNNKAQQGILGGLFGGAGAMLSDERQKKDIKPADDKIKDFLDKAGAHEYKYKDSSMPGASPGKHVSPMAQELEQSEIGKQMVINTPNGKGVDYAKSMGTLVAALASLNKRLDGLEGGGKKKMASGGVAEKDYETFPGPQKMADGGFLYGSAPKANAVAGAAPLNLGNTFNSDNPVQTGSAQLASGLTKENGGLSNLIDKGKQTLSDYFNNERSVDLENMSGDQLNGLQNPSGDLSSLDGTNAKDPFGSPLPTRHGYFDDTAGTNITPAAPSQGAALQQEGAEGAADAATAETATTAAADTAAVAEGAEAAEGASSISELAVLANKGTRANKKVPALVSPGEAHIPAKKVAAVAQGKESVKQAGKMIPGKAKVAGDSLKNDTVNKTLNEGDVIVPRSKMKDPHDAAAFVQALMFKHHGKKSK